MLSLRPSRALHSKSPILKSAPLKLKEVLSAFVTTCSTGAHTEWRALALDGG